MPQGDGHSQVEAAGAGRQHRPDGVEVLCFREREHGHELPPAEDCLGEVDVVVIYVQRVSLRAAATPEPTLGLSLFITGSTKPPKLSVLEDKVGGGSEV